MRKFLSAFAGTVVVCAGIAVAAPLVASAQTVGTTVNLTVGQSTRVALGKGVEFDVATCTSASPNTVACDTIPGAHAKPAVQFWCLGPTGVGGVTATVAYVPDGANAALPSTALTVNCSPAAVRTVHVGHFNISSALHHITAVTGCTSDVVGAACTYSGTMITKACTLAVTANTLPVLVTATVTVAGDPAINGKTVDVYFTCA